MIKYKVVVRFKDKTLLKGTISNFSPFFLSYFQLVQLELLNGDSVIVNIDKIKAVFFVKSFEGNKEYKYKYDDELSCIGDKITLTFDDGEKMVGYTEDLDYSRQGYFITPADVNGNNKHVFASKSAIDSVSFL
jgi:hypothetical protein